MALAHCAVRAESVMAIYSLGEHQPRLGHGAWVADDARLIGRVELGEHSSVWYGATLRGDNDLITLGARCNVQDGSVLHTDEGFRLEVGDDVTIGHQAMLHGCTSATARWSASRA
jgi:carbonic anhydrase/acetyltransferase-like protein (isoleucine patch superfamily)